MKPVACKECGAMFQIAGNDPAQIERILAAHADKEHSSPVHKLTRTLTKCYAVIATVASNVKVPKSQLRELLREVADLLRVPATSFALEEEKKDASVSDSVPDQIVNTPENVVPTESGAAAWDGFADQPRV
jgi:hypothetical protein